MTDNFHKNFGVILAFLAALFALLFFWTYQVYSVNAPAQWVSADVHFSDTENSDERLMSLVGFHRMIHNFKDYLLRGKQKDKESFFVHFDDAREELKQLHAHFGDKADTQIAAIDETLRKYFVSINRIDQLRGEGKTIQEIDSTITIDDKPAFAAFQDILKMYEEEQAKIRNVVLGAMAQDRTNMLSLYTTLFAIGLLLTVAVVMGLRFEFLKRRAVEQQSQTKSLLESFLDYSTVPFLIAGADGIIRHCNRAAAALLETKPKNLVGASLLQIIDVELPELNNEISTIGKHKRVSTAIELQSGKKIPVQADFSMNKDGTMRIVALFDQRSELRLRERILFEAEQKLANVTIDGSLSIRRDVQKFIDLVSDFAAEATGGTKDYAAEARDIAASMKTHITDYLAISSPVTEGHLAVNLNGLASQGIEKTIAETLEKFDQAISEKDLMFNWVNRVPSSREMDFPAQLQRIVANLVSNAVNYTRKGGAIKITTTLEQDKLILKIEDTGIGIEDEDIPKIFERGVRMKNAARMCGGLGIGLYSVKETLRNLGGDITCSSYAGIGSDFVVIIPLTQNQPGYTSAMRSAS